MTSASGLDLDSEFEELCRLRSKLKTGTADRVEREQLQKLMEHLKTATKATVTRKAEERDKRKKTITFALHEVERKHRSKEISEVVEHYKNAERIAVAFLCDATGSMGRHIQGIKDHIKGIVSSLLSSNPNLDASFAFVGYRDHKRNDGRREDKPFDIFAFSSDVDRLHSFLAGVEARDGADGCEDVHGGLLKVAELPWDSTRQTRVLFHFADAPCHGAKYHDDFDDDYKCGDPNGLQSAQLLQKLQQLGVEYHFGKINCTTDKMIETFNCEAKAFLGHGNFIEVHGARDPHALSKVVTHTLRTSIMRTATSSMKQLDGCRSKKHTLGFKALDEVGEESSKSLRAYKLCSQLPSWSSRNELRCSMWTNHPVEMAQLLPKGSTGFGSLFLGFSKATPTDGTHIDQLSVKVAPQPFAEGEQRLAYRGQLRRREGWSDCILKLFKQENSEANTQEQYLKQIETSTIAAYLATEYNRHRQEGQARIEFLQSMVVQTHCDQKYYNLELPLPSGPFIKFSNNMGYWNPDHFDSTLAKFTIWTHLVTKGHMMVVDLQGVKTRDNTFVLTDPVILCKDITRFGATNMGEEGIQRCVLGAKVQLREH